MRERQLNVWTHFSSRAPPIWIDNFRMQKNFDRKCITSDLSERFSDFKSIKKVIQQYFKLNRNVIEIILETLESYAQERHQFLQKNVRILKFFWLSWFRPASKIDPNEGSWEASKDKESWLYNSKTKSGWNKLSIAAKVYRRRIQSKGSIYLRRDFKLVLWSRSAILQAASILIFERAI